ncbi:hypothetical protein M4J07_005513 [Streptomyces longispororuber]|nr:hypothetical protein [Streptomyces longispororuber]MCQ4214156.1 hypothetical protein [Streptomyces longispororuber]
MRRAVAYQSAAVRRTTASRYGRQASRGPPPPRSAWSVRVNASDARSSAVCGSRQHTRA